MGEGEAAEESRDAEVLALVCNLNYWGYVLHSSYPDLIAARLLLKAQFGEACFGFFQGLVELYDLKKKWGTNNHLREIVLPPCTLCLQSHPDTFIRSFQTQKFVTYFQLCPLSGHYLCHWILSFCLPKTPEEALWKNQARCGKPETRAKALKKPNLENSDRVRADVGLSLEAKSALTGWVRKRKNLPKSSQKGGTSDILHDMPYVSPRA